MCVLRVRGQVWVFKKKKRKRYSKLHGHRSHITALRILDVRVPSDEQVAAATAALLQDGVGAAAANTSTSTQRMRGAATQQRAADLPGSSSSSTGGDQAAALPSKPAATRRKRLPLHLLPGRHLGPPAVTNVRSMAQPPPTAHS